MVSYNDIITRINPELASEQRSLKELISNHSIKKIPDSTPTSKVVTMLDNHLLDNIIVYHQAQPVGIITIRGIIKLLAEKQPLQAPIASYMSKPLQTIAANSSINEAMAFMHKTGFSRLIIEDACGNLIGQISQQELLNPKQVDGRHKTKQYEQASGLDLLTGIYNQQKFKEILADEIERFRRYCTPPFSILFFHIEYNDPHRGELNGMALQGICQAVENMLRCTDVFARWSHKEFVIMLPHTSLCSAITTADNLRIQISQLNISQAEQLCCSFGVREFMPHDCFESVITQAENAMYQARAEGRNQLFAGIDKTDYN